MASAAGPTKGMAQMRDRQSDDCTGRTPSRLRRLVLMFGCLVSGGVLMPQTLEAARRPTATERVDIRRAAMAYCNRQQWDSCRWGGGIKVSTVNRRYAWAVAGGDGWDSSGILVRPTRTSRKWRVLRVQGGSAHLCSYWRAVAPRRVVRDLRITAVKADYSTPVRC